MPDEPPPPPPSDSPKSTGLPSNIAAALACIPLVGGIVFFILEKRDPFVRFYSMQSIVFGLAWFLFNVVSAIIHVIFSAIPAIGGILVFFWAIIAAVIHVAFVVLWIIATWRAFTGVRWEIPYIGPMASKQVGAGTQGRGGSPNRPRAIEVNRPYLRSSLRLRSKSVRDRAGW